VRFGAQLYHYIIPASLKQLGVFPHWRLPHTNFAVKCVGCIRTVSHLLALLLIVCVIIGVAIAALRIVS